MTTEQFTSNQLVAAGWDRYSVITVSFADDGNAYNALTLLKELDSQQRVGIQGGRHRRPRRGRPRT
ncbi:MAG: hypothetical protein ACLP0J_19005 [Solirubrobacteraceae bacterium]